MATHGRVGHERHNAGGSFCECEAGEQHEPPSNKIIFSEKMGRFVEEEREVLHTDDVSVHADRHHQTVAPVSPLSGAADAGESASPPSGAPAADGRSFRLFKALTAWPGER
jgi:hypothetical protein